MIVNALAPGTAISDEYKIIRPRKELTSPGGTDVIYDGQHTASKSLVFLRVYNPVPDPELDRDLRARFIQAARTVSRLEHESFVKVVDFGLGFNGLPFMVQEYFEGHTLDQELVRHGKLLRPRVVSLMVGCLEGLATAHAMGIINRGLEPRNLLLNKPNTWTWKGWTVIR